MKKGKLLAALVLLFSPTIAGSGQEVQHAPTPEQCRADADAWGIPQWGVLMQNQDKFTALANRMMGDRTASAKELDARNAEFAQCEKTDITFSGRYVQADQAYVIAKLGRIADFMRRHNLMQQFYSEDDQGQR